MDWEASGITMVGEQRRVYFRDCDVSEQRSSTNSKLRSQSNTVNSLFEHKLIFEIHRGLEIPSDYLCASTQQPTTSTTTTDHATHQLYTHPPTTTSHAVSTSRVDRPSQIS